MDSFDPGKVFSSIDQMSRYAYGNQPGIAQWNVANLAQCLLPLMHADKEQALSAAQELVNGYPARFEAAWLAAMRAKLGLQSHAAHGDDEQDHRLASDLLTLMADAQSDFTVTFRALSHLPVLETAAVMERSEQGHTESGTAPTSGERAPGGDRTLTNLFDDPRGIADWLLRWRKRHDAETAPENARHILMQSSSPALIPRNHQVESLIRAAADDGDFAAFHALVDATAEPFVETTANAVYREPPLPAEVVQHTFCGT